MVVICISTWSSIYFVDDNVQDAPSRAPTYTGVENSCHVCHAFHLPAPLTCCKILQSPQPLLTESLHPPLSTPQEHGANS